MRGLIFFFLYSIFQATSERQTWAQERQRDRLSLFVSVPITQNNTSCLEKKDSLCKRALRSQKGFVVGKSGSSRACTGLMASFKDFSFYVPHFIPNSLLFTCQEEEYVEMQTWMYMQDVSYWLPIVCPSFISLVLCTDE